MLNSQKKREHMLKGAYGSRLFGGQEFQNEQKQFVGHTSAVLVIHMIS